MSSKLSPTELLFWYQYRFDPVSDANNIVHELKLKKRYSKERLESALKKLVEAHPALRANYVETDDGPLRFERQSVLFELQVFADVRAEGVESLIKRPFVLETDPLLRVVCEISEKGIDTLFITVPHIIFDALSSGILARDLVKILTEDITLQNYDLTYPEAESAANQYWTNTLGDIEGRVPLEVNSSAKSSMSKLGSVTTIESKRFVGAEGYAKSLGMSMSAFCISIAAVTLSKLTDSTSFIVSTPVTTREPDNLQSVGSFINVLPLAIRIDTDHTFNSIAQRISSDLWQGIENRHFSLLDITPTQNLSPRIDHQGLYNVMVEYVPEESLPDGVVRHKILKNNTAKMDLVISVYKRADLYEIEVEYDASKFNESYITQLVNVFLHVTDVVAEHENIKFDEITLVNEHDTKELLLMGSGKRKNFDDPFVWDRFEASVERYPSRVAITAQNKSVTYKELHSLAQNYALLLQASDVKRGGAVGIHMHRSAEYVAAMLAIWSLGAVYVPLDRSQPNDRVNTMINQANIDVIIADSGQRAGIRGYSAWCNILGGLPQEKPSHKTLDKDQNEIAYIIFTSGSTGTPKGVMINHIGFMNHLEIMIDELSLTKESVVAQSAPVSFDISVWQLICPLIVGASLVIVEREDLIDAERMYGLIDMHKISVIELVPSLLSAYLSAEDSDPRLASVLDHTAVITTGEAISLSVAHSWVRHYPAKPLLNAYGPAEASDDTHFFSITAESLTSINSVPIGSPLMNIRTYIVSPRMQLYPRGMIGEICIGGISVAEGYINDVELTKKSFMPDMFSDEKGLRLYRTGDYGRWNEKGELEYYGRKDHQVKVRGQRLELGEIEDQLRSIDGVKDAAVIAQKFGQDTRLRGFFVPADKEIDVKFVRDELEHKLPSYMIPWKLEMLAELPRNINGKLDRKALSSLKMNGDRQPSRHKGKIKSGILNPIVETYSEVLGAPAGVYTNYFESGGDSIKSMRIVSRLATKNIYVGVKDILRYQTPDELRQYIEDKQQSLLSTAAEWPTLNKPTPIQSHYIHKSGNKYVDQGEVQVALMSFDSGILLTEGLVLSGLAQLSEIHEELKPHSSSRPRVITSVDTNKTTHDISNMIEMLRKEVSLDTPIVACLVHEKAETRLLLLAHHYVLDYYSWTILRRELTDFFREHKIINNRDDLLKKWWGNQESKILSDPSKSKELSYWQSQIDPSATRLETGEVQEYNFSYRLSPALIAGLKARSITLETLGYYAVVRGYLSATGSSTFNYYLEDSLRTLDEAAILHNSVGWMTYFYPQLHHANSPVVEDVGLFHNNLVNAKKNGYTYGILSDEISDRESNAQEPVWTLNYTGSTTKSMEGVEVYRQPIYAKDPYIELDIVYSDESLEFNFSHNTALPMSYFQSLSHHIEGHINLLSEGYPSAVELEISTARAESIMKRLNK